MKTLPLWQMLEKWPKWQREQDNFIELALGCLTLQQWKWHQLTTEPGAPEAALWAQCDKELDGYNKTW